MRSTAVEEPQQQELQSAVSSWFASEQGAEVSFQDFIVCCE